MGSDLALRTSVRAAIASSFFLNSAICTACIAVCSSCLAIIALTIAATEFSSMGPSARTTDERHTSSIIDTTVDIVA